MAETPPLAVKAAVAVLSAALDVPVSTRVARTRPKKFVTVNPVGGSRFAHTIYLPRIVVACSAPNVAEVEQLTNQARKALADAAGSRHAGVWIRGWFNEFGPYDEPDPDVLGEERWKFHGDLNCSNK